MPGYRCETCAINVNSQQQFTQHLSGKSHLKKVKEKTIAGGTWNPLELLNSKPKLYGSFVPASDGKESENDTTSTNNQSLPSDMLPSQVTTKKAQKQAEEAVQQQTSPQPNSQADVQTVSQSGANSVINLGIQQFSQPGTVSQTLKQPTQAETHNSGDLQQPSQPPQTVGKTNVNPVVQAVVDNALGKLPTKRKMYGGKCNVCQISFNSPSQESQHFQGSKHAKKVKLTGVAPENITVEPSSTFVCQFCNVTLNSLTQYEAHRSGGKHIANFGKYKAEQAANTQITDAKTEIYTSTQDPK